MYYQFGSKKTKWLPYLLLLPGLLFYFIISLGPSIATAFYSLTDATGIKGATVNWVGLANYREFLFMGRASADNLAALQRTLIFCLAVTLIQFTLGLFIALLVNQKLKGTNLFRTIYFMPVILGAVIQGLMWRLFLYPLGGPASKLLALFGLSSEFLGGQPSEAFAWVIFIQIWANMGTTMMIFIAGLQTIPSEMYEAATIDGASTWQVFRNITWPLLTPSVNTNLLLNIIGSLQAWQLFLVLVGYRNGTQVLGYLIYATGFVQTSGSTSSSFRQLPAGLRRCRIHHSVLIGPGHWYVSAIYSTTQRTEDFRMISQAKVNKKIKWGKVGSYAVLIILALLYLGPLFMLVNTSLKTMPSFMKDATSLATEFKLGNFVEAWNKASFPKYLINSVLYTVSATFIYIITAVFIAFPIARKYIKFSGVFLTLFVIALFLPPALIPQFQLILNIGLYNNPIGYIMLFIVNPIGIVILVNYIKTVPRELDEAAALDGCGYFRFVWSIVLPLIRPALATVVVMHSIGIWNEIIAPTIYLTNKDYYPITRGLIVFQGVYGSNWPLLAAAVLLLTMPMLVLFLVLQRYIVSGLTAGAVKG